MIRLIYLLLVILILLNCSCNKKEPKPLNQLDEIAEEYILEANGNEKFSHWWLQANSPALNELIELSLKKSPDVNEVMLRLESSVIAAKQAGVSKWPVVTNTIGAYKEYNHNNSQSINSSPYSFGLLASYELDLFGKIKNKTKVAKEDVEQASYDLITAKMSLVSEIVRHWYAYQNLLKQLNLVEKQIQLQEKIIGFHENNYKLGTGVFESQVKVKQKILQYEESKNGIREALQLEELILGRLCATKDFTNKISTEKDLKFIMAPASGLPADLLRNRPDLLIAESVYQKAVLTWKVKKAERLPTIGLSISESSRSEKIKDLFDNWLLRFAANIASTLFDKGYRKDEVKKAEKAIEITVQNFKKVYLNAVLEVNQILVKVDSTKKISSDLKDQVKLQEIMVGKKEREFKQGLQKSFELYEEQIELLQRERLIWNNSFKINELNIDLLKAIGGDWFIKEDKNEPSKIGSGEK